jgi:hypothetical protein
MPQTLKKSADLDMINDTLSDDHSMRCIVIASLILLAPARMLAQPAGMPAMSDRAPDSGLPSASLKGIPR